MVKPTFKPLTPNIMTPQGAITGHELDEFVKARGGTPYRLDTGGDEIFDPFQEDGKNSKSPSKK